MSSNNVAGNVIKGSGVLYVAPLGTSLPNLDGTIPVVWPSGWKAVGYTEDGVEIQYTPTFKDVVVDEEMAPIDNFLSAEKATVSAKLAEATLVNLQRAIAGSKLSSASGSPDKATTLKVGSSALDNQVMLGFEGPAPSTQVTRIFIAYKAKAIGAIALKVQRTSQQVINGEWNILADPTKPVGERLFQFTDIGAEIES
jgi:hypothetical protein